MEEKWVEMWNDRENMEERINTLSYIFIVLDHWNNSLLIDMSPHSDTGSWFPDISP
jgi:hypothetical protein